MPAQVSNPKTAYFSKGDTAPTLRNRIEDGSGDPIDLTGATVVINIAFSSWSYFYSPKERIVDGGACVVDPDQVTFKGFVDWTPLANDLEPAGEFQYQYLITFGGGAVQTVPANTYLPMIIRSNVGAL